MEIIKLFNTNSFYAVFIYAILLFKILKQKALDSIIAQPKLAMFGIGFGIMFIIGTAVNFGIHVQEAHGASALIASLIFDNTAARSGHP
jgi:hypothetical protein